MISQNVGVINAKKISEEIVAVRIQNLKDEEEKDVIYCDTKLIKDIGYANIFLKRNHSTEIKTSA